MRVAYLLPDPGIPVGGVKGASVHVEEVCRALVDVGAEVRLFAMRAVGAPPAGVELEVFDCPALPSGAQGEGARRQAVEDFLAWAENRLAGFGADVIFERLALFAGTGGALAARLAVPRVVEVNAPVAAERARHAGLALVAQAEAAERSALDGATVLAVSRPMATWSRGRGAASVTAIPNGVDADRFAPQRNAAAAAAIRSTLGVERSELVGFVGSMKPWHGVGTLMDAVALLAPRRPCLRLLLVGEGPALADLNARASQPDLVGRCHLTGPVPSAEVPGYLAALDVAVAPYDDPGLDEGFYFSPLKVVEAMAAGRPIVASDFPPIEAMLDGTGRLVPPGDADALAEALADLLDDPTAAHALGLRARRRAMAHFSWRAVASSMLAMAGPGDPRDLALGAEAGGSRRAGRS
ncbi:MAG: glycosyltransferase family 4 protein [Candidatus Limnocylindrales bacterium]